MAIVNGPLFSLDASGAVGKALVFTKWKGRNVVREYVTPANPRSIAQRGRRTMMAILNAIWQTMDTTDRTSWADLAAAGNYSNFNGFTSYNLDAQTVSDPPTKNRSDTPTTITAECTDPQAVAGNNRIDFDFDVTTAQAGTYVVAAMANGSSSPTAPLLALVAFASSETTGAHETAVTDLPPGEYTGEFFIVTEDGAISEAQGSEFSVTVTGV